MSSQPRPPYYPYHTGHSQGLSGRPPSQQPTQRQPMMQTGAPSRPGAMPFDARGKQQPGPSSMAAADVMRRPSPVPQRQQQQQQAPQPQPQGPPQQQQGDGPPQVRVSSVFVQRPELCMSVMEEWNKERWPELRQQYETRLAPVLRKYDQWRADPGQMQTVGRYLGLLIIELLRNRPGEYEQFVWKVKERFASGSGAGAPAGPPLPRTDPPRPSPSPSPPPTSAQLAAQAIKREAPSSLLQQQTGGLMKNKPIGDLGDALSAVSAVAAGDRMFPLPGAPGAPRQRRDAYASLKEDLGVKMKVIGSKYGVRDIKPDAVTTAMETTLDFLRVVSEDLEFFKRARTGTRAGPKELSKVRGRLPDGDVRIQDDVGALQQNSWPVKMMYGPYGELKKLELLDTKRRDAHVKRMREDDERRRVMLQEQAEAKAKAKASKKKKKEGGGDEPPPEEPPKPKENEQEPSPRIAETAKATEVLEKAKASSDTANEALRKALGIGSDDDLFGPDKADKGAEGGPSGEGESPTSAERRQGEGEGAGRKLTTAEKLEKTESNVSRTNRLLDREWMSWQLADLRAFIDIGKGKKLPPVIKQKILFQINVRPPSHAQQLRAEMLRRPLMDAMQFQRPMPAPRKPTKKRSPPPSGTPSPPGEEADQLRAKKKKVEQPFRPSPPAMPSLMHDLAGARRSGAPPPIPYAPAVMGGHGRVYPQMVPMPPTMPVSGQLSRQPMSAPFAAYHMQQLQQQMAKMAMPHQQQHQQQYQQQQQDLSRMMAAQRALQQVPRGFPQGSGYGGGGGGGGGGRG
ncbi:unnamed protein product [Vitrella brassicaformis CCMP3155]|uniref:Uncharacterized protein n=1 Tax=Vitrella brassicaformis (strain CCMP3155) TaxID=1169540 RepID=A0A0G4EB12_VITBC|nr:unnamed protein product [Vitrella brassicaformis CCMP3155]|eukprot:CEL92868.1 unnamed protein product [Vitrella brassicaformis CCMP3155]